VRLTDGRDGRLTEVIDTGTGFEALAVLPVESAVDADDNTSPGVPATPLPLPYALPQL
jgi:hypothetical protein